MATDNKHTKNPDRAQRQAERALELAKHQQTDKLPQSIKQIGRPATAKPLSEEQKSAILALLMEGHTLTKICQIKGMPTVYEVGKHASTSSTFAEELARAREIGAGVMADKIIDIADEIALDSAAVQRNRLRIEARARVAGWYNKKFSDKSTPEEVAGIVAATIEAARARYNKKRKPIDITPKPLKGKG